MLRPFPLCCVPCIRLFRRNNLYQINPDQAAPRIRAVHQLPAGAVGYAIAPGDGLTGQVVIKRDDFEIVGQTGEFNTRTRFARFLGNVKMTILNTENFDK